MTAIIPAGQTGIIGSIATYEFSLEPAPNRLWLNQFVSRLVGEFFARRLPTGLQQTPAYRPSDQHLVAVVNVNTVDLDGLQKWLEKFAEETDHITSS